MQTNTPRVAYQGTAGAYSEAAIHQVFPKGATAVPCRTFGETLDAMLNDCADLALLPVENSVAGPVEDALAELRERQLLINITRFISLPIRHALLAIPGSSLEEIREVRSHPMALAQCRRFLATLNVRTFSSFDTAGAAHEIAIAHDKSLAAIASDRAGVHFGLVALATAIQDDAENATRFVLATPRGRP